MASTEPPHRTSLLRQLMGWLLLPLALLAALDLWITYRDARHTATLVQQRMLLGAARMIGQQIEIQDGLPNVVLPPAALELFASPYADRVYYRITRAGGELLLGYPELPPPPQPPAPDEAVYFDTWQNQQAVHAVAFSQPVLSAPTQTTLLIEVAQTLVGRDALAGEIWRSALWRQLGLLSGVALLLGLGLRRGLRPVTGLRDQVLARQPGTLEPLPSRHLPTELAPLADAMTDYAARLDHHMSAHSRFIADAAHQLRTPLTVLNTQLVFALRQSDEPARQEALRAAQTTLQHGTRLVQQLLSFSAAEASRGHPDDMGPLDLSQTAREVLEHLALLAAQREIDLGFEAQGRDGRKDDSFEVAGSARLLHELCANLIDNALRYTPPGGAVTLRLRRTAGQVLLEVEDNGPGIPPALRERVFERFFRLDNQQSDGCGLGLAIVREIAQAHGASVQLGDGPQGQGLCVTVAFPACTA
ncbi:MAG: sensor histidine kinase [Curvibacter lanceolatus]|uniref:sensor histidine kinase n=1 Tax=Curvibacter lanceolatus TaxID=86182 RepID=UPI002354F806|nr:sensor histidine kinase [Curvibacter lanceolatus]MBV5295075.1 sensor histidine kinase [Curvibacter lanceolatus]